MKHSWSFKKGIHFYEKVHVTQSTLLHRVIEQKEQHCLEPSDSETHSLGLSS